MIGPRANLDGLRNALIVRWDRVGDLVCAIPAIRAFRQRCPQAKVTGLLSRFNHDLLRGTALVDEVVVWRRDAGLRKKAALALELRRRRFDCVLLLVTSDEAYPLAVALGARVRAGAIIRRRVLTRAFADACLTHRSFIDQESRYRSGEPSIHEVEKGLGVVRALGIEVADPTVSLALPPDVRARCRAHLAAAGRHPVIAVPMCRRYAAAGWTPEGLQHLVRSTMQAFADAFVLVTAGPQEADEGRLMRAAFGGAPRVIVIEQPPLQEWAGLMQQAALVVSINSASVHLAASGGVPAVVLCPEQLLHWRGHEEWHPWQSPFLHVDMRHPRETIPLILDAAAALWPDANRAGTTPADSVEPPHAETPGRRPDLHGLWRAQCVRRCRVRATSVVRSTAPPSAPRKTRDTSARVALQAGVLRVDEIRRNRETRVVQPADAAESERNPGAHHGVGHGVQETGHEHLEVAGEPHPEMHVVQADVNLTHARQGHEVVDPHTRRRRFDEQRHVGTARHQVDEAPGFPDGGEHRQHQHLRPQRQALLDLNARPLVHRVRTDEQAGGRQPAPNRRHLVETMIGDPARMPALPLGLAETLEVEPDAVDTRGIGTRRHVRIVREQGELDRLPERHGRTASPAGVPGSAATTSCRRG